MGLHDPLLTIVKKRKMQFYGHTNRAGNLATTILQGSVDGKRGRGRPRTTWLKNIVDWTGLAINDLHTYSMDRQKWKMTIDAVAHGAPTTATVTGYRGGGGGGCLRDDYTAVSFARPRTQIRLSPYYPQTEPRLQCKRWLSSGPYHAVHVLICSTSNCIISMFK